MDSEFLRKDHRGIPVNQTLILKDEGHNSGYRVDEPRRNRIKVRRLEIPSWELREGVRGRYYMETAMNAEREHHQLWA